jgi:hypothetical protein
MWRCVDEYNETQWRNAKRSGGTPFTRMNELSTTNYVDVQLITRMNELSTTNYADVQLITRMNELSTTNYADVQLITRMNELSTTNYADVQLITRMNELSILFVRPLKRFLQLPITNYQLPITLQNATLVNSSEIS